ncbi:cellulose synthase regulator protein [Oxobacter pfennigii]|uniref:Cellulose synthase regulator protein n=1 Tax=Oxobacter pfennigii TaxID=36849 RepID=A0A0P8YDD4_9CLOT|nr:cellulose synthase regulator protein [Oxobacter pfennigii]
MQFENLPYPFSRDNDLDNTTIVLPDNPQKQDLAIAGNIAELLGISIENNEGIIYAVKGAAIDEEHKADNLIIFGTPDKNSVIKDVNKSLWFRYNDLFTTVLSNEKYELLPETSKTATFIELKASPYNNKKGMLTITSLDNQSIRDSMAYFMDDKRGLLTGDAAIISKDGELVTLRFQKDEGKRPDISAFNITNKFIWNYIIFAGAVLLLMSVGLGLYLYKNRKAKETKVRKHRRPGGRRRRG